MFRMFRSFICFIAILSITASCTSVPNLQNRLVEHAQREDEARINLDEQFKSKCSLGKELYNVPRKKIASTIECASKIFDETFLEEARYKDLALGLKQYLVNQSASYSKGKISRKIFKSRVITAWNTYNVEWIKRSEKEVNDTVANNEDLTEVAEGAAIVVAIVALVAIAAAGGGGGSGNSYANGYSGNCMCPGDMAADGSRCGGRSAYSRSGGANPYCPVSRL
jgi:hypothetical protein